MSKNFSVVVKYVEARPRSQRHKGAEARSGASSVGVSSTVDLSALENSISVVNSTLLSFRALFDELFEKDTENNAIKAKLSLYSLGGITAGGAGSDNGSGGSSYNRLDSWGDYSADKAGYVLSALLGNELNQRLTTMEGAGYITQSALANYALRSEIPSLAGYATEDFVTSRGYITASALNGYATQTWVNNELTKYALASAIPSLDGYAKLTDIPTSLPASDVYAWAKAPTKPSYTASEVGALSATDTAVDSAKLGGQLPSYYATAEALSALSEAFATEQGYIDTLQGYFTNGKANDALKLGGQLPSYYATATALTSLTATVTEFKALFDSLFEKDTENNAIKAKLSLYSLGGITAGGVGSDSSSGGGSSYSRLDSWGDYSADKAGYVLSALLGNELNQRLTTVEGAGYITQSALANYALRSEIPSLAGYATEDFVTSRGYITASALSGYAKTADIPTKVSALTNDSGYITSSALNGYATQSWVEGKGYITGLTSSMITTALGYTPYNLANFTKANIKSTLGISDWALAATKPTYTASEVGALGATSAFNAEVLTDLNSATAWKFFTMTSGYGSTDGNKPDVAWVSGLTGRVHTNSAYRWQFASSSGTARPYFRSEFNGVWVNWSTLAFTSDLPTKLSDLTDDVVAGKYLPLSGGTVNGSITATSFIGNLTGNADSATKLATPRSIWGNSFDGTGDIVGDIKFNPWYNNETFGVYRSGEIRFTSTTLGGWATSWKVYKSDKTSFIGDIAGAFGSVDTLSYFYYGGSFSSPYMAILSSGNVAIGGTSASEKLTVHGNILSSANIKGASVTVGSIPLTYDATNSALCVNGNFYATGGVTAGGASDGRLKQNVLTMTEQEALATVMALRPVTFKWNALARAHDGRLYGNSQGFIAQEFERLIENSGRAIYGHYRAIDTTKAIPYLTTVAQNHERRIEVLEQENKVLRAEVEQLRKVA